MKATPFAQKPFLLACSGGVDSMVLLDLLTRAHEQGKVKDFEVVYIDHGQRHDTEKDRDVVRQYCSHAIFKKLKIPKMASEAELRDLRYRCLAETAEGRAVLTAHHADDVFETFLFRLLRGATPSSFRGIPESGIVRGCSVFRPLLSFWKSEILDYAIERKLRWHEDSTNPSPRYARNRIRNELIPLLESLRPGSARRAHAFFEEVIADSAKNGTAPRRNESDRRVADALRSGALIDVEKISFEDLRDGLNQILDRYVSKTTKSHWNSIRRQLELKRSRKNGEMKTIQLPGGRALIFHKHSISLKKVLD